MLWLLKLLLMLCSCYGCCAAYLHRCPPRARTHAHATAAAFREEHQQQCYKYHRRPYHCASLPQRSPSPRDAGLPGSSFTRYETRPIGWPSCVKTIRAIPLVSFCGYALAIPLVSLCGYALAIPLVHCVGPLMQSLWFHCVGTLLQSLWFHCVGIRSCNPFGFIVWVRSCNALPQRYHSFFLHIFFHQAERSSPLMHGLD